MKKLKIGAFISAIAILLALVGFNNPNTTLKKDFVTGSIEIGSINKIAFGPEGILFLGDSQNATIYALDTAEEQNTNSPKEIRIDELDKKIAAALGTTVDAIRINDMAVNPVSKSVYLSVNVTDGTPVLLKLKNDVFEHVSLNNVSYSKIGLVNAIAADAKDRRGRSQRVWAIADLQYHNGNILVSGLSNKEFGSTFRSIPFPFIDSQEYASLEVYHAAHGRYETYAPIKTFNVVSIEGKDYLMASYTCTPLVLFPIDELKAGKHVKGRTVAEFGYGNTPLDIVSYKKDGKSYFLMSNSNRPVMRINYEDVANSTEDITEKVSGVEGVDYFSLPMVNVQEMDMWDENTIIYVQRTGNGDLIMRTRGV